MRETLQANLLFRCYGIGTLSMLVRISLIQTSPYIFNQNKLTNGTGFLASSWHIRSRGMFAGSCIGVICLVIALEFLRRIAREYDAFIVHRAQMRAQYLTPAQNSAALSSSDSADASGIQKSTATGGATCPPAASSKPIRVRPNLIEQLIRALLHMLQFAVAYFVMLLAMYFNGYIIICIFIGAFLGSFIFSWEYIGGGSKEYVAYRFFYPNYFLQFWTLEPDRGKTSQGLSLTT